MSIDRTETFVMRNISGGSMKYTAHFVNDVLINVTRKGKTLKRGKDLYSLRKYAFAADAYGKSQTVKPAARRQVAEMRKKEMRQGVYDGDLEQKGRLGGRPSVKARKKDVGRQTRQKRYEAIIRRIKGIRDCSRKEAQKIYKHYLPSICAGYPPESNTPRIVMISRSVSDPDKPITWLYKDEQSPKSLFQEEGVDYEDQTPDYTYLRAVRPRVTYGEVISRLPDRSELEVLWGDSHNEAGHYWINADYMSFVGCAADEDIVLK